VNYVNASIMANDRGIKISETKSADAMEFTNLVSIRVDTDAGSSTVSGTVFGKSESRIVKINDYYLDVNPAGDILVLSNTDKPGMIGKIGTILGESGINIASMEVGRKAAGSDALTVINLDAPADEKVVDKIRGQEGIKGVKTVKL